MTYRSSDGGSDVPDSPGSVAQQSPSTRVAFRLAEATGKSIEELRPLADSVDPEALDAIFDGRASGNAYVTFRHEDYAITVTGDGDVLVDPVEDQ